MPRIQLFGYPTVETDAGPAEGKAVQRHRLALLAVLACAPGRTLARDQLVALLWPDANGEDGRHSLNTAIHAIRRQFGERMLISRLDAVSLADDVQVDVTEFDEALRRGERERAVQLRTAPLLDGFHIGDSSPFDDWASAERQRVATAYQSTLEGLASDAEAAGDLKLAASWWRAAVTENPVSTRLTTRLMRVLVRSGDQGDAIRAGEEHVDALERQLAAEPDEEFRRYLRRLREEPRGVLELASPTEGVRNPPSARGRRIVAVIASTIVLAVSGIIALTSRRFGTRDQPDALLERIAVIPFVVRGISDTTDIGHGISELLATGLDLPGEVLAVEPGAVSVVMRQARDTAAAAMRHHVGTTLGAGRVVTGDVLQVGEQVRVSAVVWSVRETGTDSALVTFSGQGTHGELFALVDRLTASVLAASSARGTDRLERIAVRTTDSLDALKQFLSGSRAYRRGEYALAASHFERATEIDPSFSLAYFRLATAAEWAIQYDRARQAAAKAVELADRLAPTERLMAEALNHYLTASTRQAERMLEEVVALRPEDTEAWFRLAEVQFHCYAYRDRPMEDSRQAWRNVLGRDSVHTGALLHLMRLAALEQDSTSLDRLAARLRLVSPRADRLFEARTLQAFVGGRAAAERASLAELTTLGDSAVLSAVQGLTAFSDHVDGGRALALALRNSRQVELRKLALVRLAEVEMAAGRPDAADHWLAELGGLDATLSRVHRAYFATLPGVAASPIRLDSLLGASADAPLRATPGPGAIGPFATLPAVLPELHFYTKGRLAARLGRWTAAADAAAQLRKLGGPPDAARLANDFALSLDALTALQRSDTASAERLLSEAKIETRVELLNSSWFFSQSAEQWLRALLAQRNGRDDVALNTFAAVRHSRIFAAPAALAMAEIHERRGYRLGALREFRRVQRLLHNAEPSFAHVADSAARRLRALGDAGGIGSRSTHLGARNRLALNSLMR